MTDAEIALHKIKAIVCGEKHPNWSSDQAIFHSRGRIADLCDFIVDPSLAAARKRMREEQTLFDNMLSLDGPI